VSAVAPPGAPPSGRPSPALTALTLRIDDMTCASCATRVERALNKVPGVRASVNYATHQARVFAPPTLDTATLIGAVEHAGYGASVPDPESPPPDEAAALAWRMWLAIGAGLPVVVLSMVPGIQFPGWQWVCLALTLPVYTLAGWRFHRATLLNLRHRAVTMDTLISVGTTAALAWSLFALIAGGAGHIGYRHAIAWHLQRAHSGADIYLEAVVAIIAFLLIGRYAEARATTRAGAATRELLALVPTQATLLDDGRETSVPAEALRVGDLFVVRPGERIATDGVVVEGHSALDNAVITGESLPVEVGPACDVVGAAVNTTGRLVVRATRVGANTQMSQIARLVDDAQSSKSQVQRLADAVAGVFVPIVLALAVVTLAVWALLSRDASTAVSAGVAVVIIACPCALGLATPVALLTASGRGAQLGILVRGAAALEAAHRVDVVVLDKTGTLTTGVMAVADVRPVPGQDRDELVAIAAAAEAGSEHPIARAIASLASGDGPAATDVTAVPGAGVRAVVDGRPVLAGRPDWVGAQLVPARPDAADSSSTDATLVAVAWDGRLRGTIAVRDQVRATSAAAVAGFRRMGLRPVLLTGDTQAVAQAVATAVGIDDVRSGVAPADKAATIAALQAQGHRVAMVGDGVNDAAALAQADLGIAMGAGTGAAIAAADLTLMRSDLGCAVDAVRLARASFATIRTNMVWACAYNVVAIPIAACGLLNPMIAGAAMACSSLFVVGNSLRLRRFKP